MNTEHAGRFAAGAVLALALAACGQGNKTKEAGANASMPADYSQLQSQFTQNGFGPPGQTGQTGQGGFTGPPTGFGSGAPQGPGPGGVGPDPRGNAQAGGFGASGAQGPAFGATPGGQPQNSVGFGPSAGGPSGFGSAPGAQQTGPSGYGSNTTGPSGQGRPGGQVIPHPEPGMVMQAAQRFLQQAQGMCQQGQQQACQFGQQLNGALQQAQQDHPGCHSGDRQTCSRYLQISNMILSGGGQAGGQNGGPSSMQGGQGTPQNQGGYSGG